ncbi:MAG: leucine-rich repeat protein [Oscillospiraceae bacterium]|nr:leucine-rich repeat protein [Oscillospiraceae bacterium]
MKRQFLSLALALVLLAAATVAFSTAAVAAADFEAVYQWNAAVFGTRSVCEGTLAFYRRPDDMIQSAHPEIAALSESITGGLSGDYEKARAIHQWVAGNVWYDNDVLYGRADRGDDSALGTLQTSRSVCTGYTHLSVALMRAAGIPARSVSGYALGYGGNRETFFDICGNEANHAWTEAYADGRWMIIDTTWDSRNIYEHGRALPRRAAGNAFFDISLREVSATHRFSLWFDAYVTDAIIPGYITRLGDAVFWENASMVSAVIPYGVTSIGEAAFKGCSALTSVTLPDSVTSIGGWAFWECAALTDMFIPDSVTHIGDWAFMDCVSLTGMTIPGSVGSIGEGLFWGAEALKSVVILDGVTSIGRAAFAHCAALESAVIPPSVTSIGDWAFFGCGNLTIYGEAGSYAETHAREKGFAFAAGAPGQLAGQDSPAVPEPPPPAPNLGTADGWAREGIQSAFEKGFIPIDMQGGYDRIITRAEFCRMAVKWLEYVLGKDIETILAERSLARSPGAFSDTDDPAILAAYALGITAGEIAPAGAVPGRFNPSGHFTREQAAMMIMNTARAIGADTAAPPPAAFADLSDAGAWALPGIGFVSAHGIMRGTGGGSFSPKEPFDRQQSIVTFDNIMYNDLPGR